MGRLLESLLTVTVFLTLVPAITWFVLLCSEFGSQSPVSLAYSNYIHSHNQFAFNNASFTPSKKRYRIALCAKVDDEIPYILEWIEFHRIQGVDKFDLYSAILPGDPHSVKVNVDLTSITALYGSLNESGLVTIIPTPSLTPDVDFPLLYEFNDTVLQIHRMQQHTMLSHCAKRNRDIADWILHIDVDEFVYGVSNTLWEWLQNYNKHLRLRQLLDPRGVVGFTFPPRNFGVGRMMFDFHTRVVSDVASGAVQVFFDPRDSGVWKDYLDADKSRESEMKSRETLFGSRETHDEIVRWLVKDVQDERLNASVKAAGDEGNWSRFQFMKSLTGVLERLETGDIDGALRQLRHKFTSLYIPNATLPFSPPGADPTPLSLLLQQARAQKAALEASSSSGVFPPTLSERDQLTDQILHQWGEFYPILIQEQISTSPGLQTDNYKTVFEDETSRVTLSQLIFKQCNLKPHKDCREFARAPPAGWMTRLGKSIYSTDRMFRSAIDRRSSSLPGCLVPWVHHCSHQLDTGEMYDVTPDQGVRLDHHQFRSIEKRTTKLPTWRGGPVGYAAKEDFVDWLKWFQLDVDMVKWSLGKLVRDRIVNQFRPIPKFFKYHEKQTASGSVQFHSHEILSACSPFELLSELQVPCPASHPYVGVLSFGDQSPSVKLPYYWCTDVKRPEDDYFAEDAWVLTYNQFLKKLGKSNHFVMCPGWPESRCCTALIHDDDGREVSLWETGWAVLVTDKYERWQTSLGAN
eukprot:Blabericola_migrator_1__735@NODE_1183_length_5191_cov_163_280445_g805_i0_p1_GENE_NODE_1183_length_5191_cov_163_280445_g805_i0NODE_1183_length_5191_cov_163_280445_g805_i0_p1_ORF_typecomplete_len747_score116_11Glyco_transf_92/PF01697_27/4_1e20Glyco_transf_92/PF01697_27/1_1Glyco_tranf_2_4/PF13704_6/3_6e08DUF4406/PF14359_6/0_84_NODE_1183_length_5191_cov_163_280445_g805_i028905130